MEDLTTEDKALARSELLSAMMNRSGMAKDLRIPAIYRDHYTDRVNALYRVYMKLGGHLSVQEITR